MSQESGTATAEQALPAASGGHPSGPGGSGIQRSLLTASLAAIRLGPGLLLVVLLAVFTVSSSVFFTADNLRNILAQSCVAGALALGMLPVILTRALDLSVSSTIALSTVLCAKFYAANPSLGALVIPMFILVGAGVGLVNALLIVKLGLNVPLIVTLGTLYVFQSLAYIASDGATIVGMPSSVTALTSYDVFGLPLEIIVVGICGLVMTFALKGLVWGRWVYAIGGSPEAAPRVGIRVNPVLMSTYILCGAFAGLAGMLVASASNAGYANAGNLSNLDAIAAVVIGGASLFGGRGGVIGALVGAVVLGVIHNGLTLAGVNPNWTPFAVGSILVFAVGLDTARTKIERRVRLRQALLEAGDA